MASWFANGDHWIVIGTIVLAAAALAQVELTRRTAKRQLRAYVMPTVATITDYASVNPPPPAIFVGKVAGIVELKNSGQTPAYDVIHWNSVVVIPTGQEDALAFPKPLLNVGSTTVGPGCSIHKASWTNQTITPQDIAAIHAGTSAIYIYGIIVYRDAFKRKRETTYRLFYYGNYPPASGATLTFCHSGNKSN